MKIWTNNSDGELVLCDHGREGPSNFVPSVVRKKDILTFVQGSFARPKSRGNAYRSWSFSVSREHTSVAAAELHLLTLHQTVPSQAAVTVELSDQATRYILPDCCIDVSPSAPLGVRTVVTYTLTFGAMYQPVDLADSLGIELNDAGGTELSAKGENE